MIVDNKNFYNIIQQYAYSISSDGKIIRSQQVSDIDRMLMNHGLEYAFSVYCPDGIIYVFPYRENELSNLRDKIERIETKIEPNLIFFFISHRLQMVSDIKICAFTSVYKIRLGVAMKNSITHIRNSCSKFRQDGLIRVVFEQYPRPFFRFIFKNSTLLQSLSPEKTEYLRNLCKKCISFYDHLNFYQNEDIDIYFSARDKKLTEMVKEERNQKFVENQYPRLNDYLIYNRKVDYNIYHKCKNNEKRPHLFMPSRIKDKKYTKEESLKAISIYNIAWKKKKKLFELSDQINNKDNNKDDDKDIL